MCEGDRESFEIFFLLEAGGSKATQDSENNQTSHHDDFLLLIGRSGLYLALFRFIFLSLEDVSVSVNAGWCFKVF